MKKTFISPNSPKALGPYSHAVEGNGFVFVSGQIGIDPATGKLLDTVEEQARQALKNVESILRTAGVGMADVVKTLVFLKDMNNFAAINAIYAEVFTAEHPARSCIEVSNLPGGALFEIEVIAAKP